MIDTDKPHQCRASLTFDQGLSHIPQPKQSCCQYHCHQLLTPMSTPEPSPSASGLTNTTPNAAGGGTSEDEDNEDDDSDHDTDTDADPPDLPPLCSQLYDVEYLDDATPNIPHDREGPNDSMTADDAHDADVNIPPSCPSHTQLFIALLSAPNLLHLPCNMHPRHSFLNLCFTALTILSLLLVQHLRSTPLISIQIPLSSPLGN